MISDNIGVNFIMELGESIVNDDTAAMTFEINGKKTEVAVKNSTETVLNGKTVYSFPCYSAAAEMTDVISAQIVTSTYSSEVFTYTVQDYAQNILEHSEDYGSTVSVVKAMLNYGTAAQEYFRHNTENPANSILAEDDREILPVTKNDLLPYKYKVTDNDADIDFVGQKLSLKNRVILKLYFSGKSNKTFTVNDFAVSVGDEIVSSERLSVGSDSNGQYLAIKEMCANEYDKSFTISVGDLTISNISVFSYLERAVSGNKTELSDLVNTMYAFNKALLQMEYIPLRGDANHDGRVNSHDAYCVISDIISGELECSLEEADINCDGCITAQDAAIILKILTENGI